MECPTLSDNEFQCFRQMIYRECGINLTPNKKVMLAGRLIKRLIALGFSSFAQYMAYLESPAAIVNRELISLIDEVSTNKTEFFREVDHFDFLAATVLPQWLASAKQQAERVFRVWSAGCSTGEEPYTLAMVLEEFLGGHASVQYRILATDISTRVLQKASQGVYEDEKMGGIPSPYVQKYFMKGKGPMSGFHRIVPELRRRVDCARVNFLAEDFAVEGEMDSVFCRNVLIYFDKITQEKVLGRIAQHLTVGGYLFTGHAESMFRKSDTFEKLAPSVYRKKR